ncbi:flagellar basal-body rod protein FlgF [Cupriavidus gilardii]|uniref:Flagellar basal-body rod protein FlgF n=2 Tax=Cupriavidus TaxID=106589 RepID=A0A5A8ETK5_9BURK|nr:MULTISPECIES: flagellar basal-body rod protein FlgF [Cupriavidus]ALD93586.1 flagellar basal body rod protein FlgF [Cupriavidus gilardii CR3]QQE08890.1 flagellar basal-body rod protein FlgF [Cupriavidus sp. ISTL7]ESJ17568.1 flagellar basal body rod protein FlgF [Cupriavidus sp. HPC(L)]KAA0179310.1 flagellar basal-body rod protein FlgF [Cupriavidus gilardii]KAA6118018.1 flagellar basal-body rod protein FlgF [Cupriavidus cauae]
MDRLIYTALSGAKQTLDQQAAVANNLANVSTTGFRAQVNMFRAVPVVGQETPTRAFTLASTPGADMKAGPLTYTERPLDIAIKGNGWLAVQGRDGAEGYTRAGSLQVGPDGQLLTSNGLQVLGDGGPIAVPPGSTVTIGNDGTITARGPGETANGLAQVGRLRLVNPPPDAIARGDDGLFRLRPGAAPLETDQTVRVIAGALEGSNVNPVEAMVDMIANARRFEMQIKMIQGADANEQRANALLSNR